MDKSKIKKIAVFALILALIAISAIDIFTIHEDNTELCQWNQTLNACTDGRFLKTNYSNSNVIEIFLIAHNPSSTTMVLNLSINGTVVLEKHMRTNPANDAHLSISAMIPANTNYSVDASEVHHIEWREYQVTGSGLGSGVGQKGDKGDPGQNGTIGYNGTDGVNGTNGTSANMTEINNSLNLKLNKTVPDTVSAKINFNFLDGNASDETAPNRFIEFYHNNSIRTYINRLGSQLWFLNNSGVSRGLIAYVTPNNLPGIAFLNDTFATNSRRDIRGGINGMDIVIYSNGSTNQSTFTTDGKLQLDRLSGTGNAYMCLDSNGKTYRGNPGC